MGSAYVIQVAERIEADIHQMEWRTVIEVAKILPEEATVTQAECTAAVEAARAICCLARTGCMCFDFDGNLIEDFNKKQDKEKERNESRLLT